MNSPRSALIRPKPPSPKSPRKKRSRWSTQSGRLASQNLSSPHPPLTTKRFSRAGLEHVFRPQTPHKPPAKPGRILPPLRFPRPPLIGMRRLRLKSRLPHPHSPQPPPTRSLNPKPLLRKPRSPRKTISVRKEPRRSTPPPWLSARSPAPSDVPRHDPNPQPPQRRRIHGPQPRNPFCTASRSRPSSTRFADRRTKSAPRPRPHQTRQPPERARRRTPRARRRQTPRPRRAGSVTS